MALADPPVTYRAFISYSHRDAAFARRLHRQLESYRLPTKLVGSETARGTVPERLSPIFRDREELSAGESLSDQVLAALAASEALITICSPNAKASVWVGKEIESFRLLHPNRPVLAALIDGEPGEAFPSALTQIGPDLGKEQAREPIAADFRKGTDGHRLARLKLAAGLTGVALDALVQRDAQRQFRRVMAITVAAVVALLVMAGLLVMALQARKEADRQRDEAEGLVEYMLTDLRDKLKGVTSLDVMTAVNERAMAYYGDQQSLAGLPPESLDRRARILHAMGEDDEKRGDLDKALAKFKEAHRTTEAVLAQKPNDADSIFAHAQSEYWVGYVAFAQRQKANAQEHWNSYAALARELNRVAPRDKRSLLEVSYAQGNLCGLALEPPIQKAQALEFCRAALTAGLEIRRLEPTDIQIAQSLANKHAWYADALTAAGDTNSALKHREMQGKIIANLVSIEPENREIRFRQAVYYVSMFRIFKKHDRKKRHIYLSLSRDLLLKLIREDPTNDVYRKYLNYITF